MFFSTTCACSGNEKPHDFPFVFFLLNHVLIPLKFICFQASFLQLLCSHNCIASINYTLTKAFSFFLGDSKSTSVEVDINIADANDNPPSFRELALNIPISESALPGTPVYTLIADDPDVGSNKVLTYVGYSPEGKFEINPQTGVITTVGKLDYEEQQK